MDGSHQIRRRLTTACTRRRFATLRGAGEADRYTETERERYVLGSVDIET
jgi:hypothetical protein